MTAASMAEAEHILGLPYGPIVHASPPFRAGHALDLLAALHPVSRVPTSTALALCACHDKNFEEWIDATGATRSVAEAWEVWTARGLLPATELTERGVARVFVGDNGVAHPLPGGLGAAFRFALRWPALVRAEALLDEVAHRFAVLGMPAHPVSSPQIWHTGNADALLNGAPPWYRATFDAIESPWLLMSAPYARAEAALRAIDAQDGRIWRQTRGRTRCRIDCEAALLWAVLDLAYAPKHLFAALFSCFSFTGGIPPTPFAPLVELWAMGVAVAFTNERWRLIWRCDGAPWSSR